MERLVLWMDGRNMPRPGPTIIAINGNLNPSYYMPEGGAASLQAGAPGFGVTSACIEMGKAQVWPEYYISIRCGLPLP